MHNLDSKISVVLFDLDGTLLDTAPDLAYALNHILIDNQLSPLPYELIRPVASHGAKGLLQLGFGVAETHLNYAKLRQQLLNIYQQHLCVRTELFPQMEEVLSYINNKSLQWGIVTNKPSWLTEPLLKQINLPSQTSCIVSGDSTARSKPYPDPLLHACKILNCQPNECVYIGDAERDIQAGISAGMRTIVALYGYIAHTDRPNKWGANGVIQNPIEIIDWIEQQNASPV